MKILFRTAGGATDRHELGTGHVFRCINLANEFKKRDIFFAIEDYGGMKEVFIKKKFKKTFFLKPNISMEKDYLETLKIIKKQKIELLVVDKYQTKNKFLQKISKYVPTVYISDLNNYEYQADLIINGFIGIKNAKIKNKFGALCILGPKYQILSKNTYQKNIKNPKYDVLITLGGYDKNQNLEKIAKILPDFLTELKIKIIIGSSTKKSTKIIALEKKYVNSLNVISHSNSIKKEIANARFGLCGGGITTYEFALQNKPFFVICQYNHQILTAKNWKKMGYSHDYISPNEKLTKLEKFLQKIIDKKIVNRKKKLRIDDLGSLRIKKEIQRLGFKPRRRIFD